MSFFFLNWREFSFSGHHKKITKLKSKQFHQIILDSFGDVFASLLIVRALISEMLLAKTLSVHCQSPDFKNTFGQGSAHCHFTYLEL